MRANLLTLVDAYTKAKKSAVSSASREIHGDSPFFGELKKLHRKKTRTGRAGSFTARKYDDMILKFAALWPEGCQWPSQHTIYPAGSLVELQIEADKRFKKLARKGRRV